jgi:hypothetical protein
MVVTPTTIPDWRARIKEMAVAWTALAFLSEASLSEEWPTQLLRIRTDYLRLVAEGRWTSGPRDLMGVLGATDDELSHSRVLAWLLQATGRHGLGASVLERIMRAGWPEAPIPDLGMAAVRREVPRHDELGATRADVVVTVGATVLVIENKVWAPESEGQCEAQYRHWHDEADDVRFLFLSRNGHLPRTAISPDARAAWRAMSYRQLAGLIDEQLSGVDAASTGGMAVRQYRAALERLVGSATEFSIITREQA